MNCCQCQKPITDKNFLESGDLKLHQSCLEAYEAANHTPCAQCKNMCTDEFVELTSAGGAMVTLHPQCVDAYKRSTRPKCGKCGEVIMDNSRMQLGAVQYHTACAPTKPAA